jgi:hypothetical protein
VTATRKIALGLLTISLTAGNVWAKVEPAASAASYGDRACSSTREFVATLEFLRSVKEFALPEPEARKVAESIAVGCTHAGRRFIQVAQTLLKAGLGGKDTLKTAQEFAHRTEGEARAFIGIFRLSFLEDGLDLDLLNSIQMARELSVQFVGESVWAYDDFRKIVEFCVRDRGLDLPKAACGQLASRIAKKSEVANGGVAADFMKIFKFAVDSKNGPGVTTGKALALAEEVAVVGPDAVENFISAYRYAIREKGLGLPADEAFSFARKMALTTPGTKTRN